MSHFQINQPQTKRLLKAGCAPRLLTTRIIPASAITNSESEKNETTILREQILPPDCTNVVSSNSKLKLATVKLLGKIKGGMPGEQYALPGECPKCRTLNSLRRGEAICPHCRLSARFDALIEGRKLPAAVWEKIRRTLCLPTEIKNLSAEQARSVLQLLDSFVDKFSFDEQESMTGKQIKTALVNLPGLPKLFSKSLRVASTCPEFDNAKRKPISAQKFTKVAARQGSYCYWCGIKIIRESEIPPANRIIRNHATLVYLSADGEMREEAFGTIDHLVRVTDGGDNSLPNLVISCHSCNQEREKATLVHNRPFARRRLPCAECGGRFFHPDWGCCSICGAIPEQPKRTLSLLRYVIESFVEIIKKRYEN